MSAMASQITGAPVVYWTLSSGADQREQQTISVTGLCEGNSPHKEPDTRKMFPFDDVIMYDIVPLRYAIT